MQIGSDETVNKPSIVILGAGYGGMITTVNLQKMLGQNEARITLVNKHDYHYQTTWLHESAAGTLEPNQARIDINDVLNLNKVSFIKDKVISIEPEKNQITLENEKLSYDILVIGLGFKSATLGIPGLKENSISIGSIDSARLIREHIAYNFAKYSYEEEKDDRRLNIVIGGAGFTSIEFVGELANRIPELCKEYDIDKAQVRLIAIESATTIMPEFDHTLVEYARTSLESRGVEFITNARLIECNEDYVVYEKEGDQTVIQTKTIIWAAGVKANPIVEQSGFKAKHGKVEVRDDVRTQDYDNVFVVGDCALYTNSETGNSYPATAQIAVQAAEVVANNITSLIRGNELTSFKPKIRGAIASLGYDDAVGMISNNRKLFGWKAIVLKKMINNRYLYKLGGIQLLLNKGKFNVFY